MNRPIALLDANVLYPARLRDLLIRLAIAGSFRALWSEAILDECFRNIAANRPDLDESRLTRTRTLMNAAIVDASVAGYEQLIEQIELPDVDDRHVVAAAIKGSAALIITSNLPDFPKNELDRYGITALSPEDFLGALHRKDPETVGGVLAEQAAALRNPPTTVEELIESLADVGLRNFVAAVRSFEAG